MRMVRVDVRRSRPLSASADAAREAGGGAPDAGVEDDDSGVFDAVFRADEVVLDLGAVDT